MTLRTDNHDDSSEWDGTERRSGDDRRSGWDRRGNHPYVPPTLGLVPPVRSWSDIHALIWVGVTIIGGIAWGLKLESRIDSLVSENRTKDVHIVEIDKTLDKGILPLTEERLQRMHADLVRLQGQCDSLQLAIQKINLDIERNRSRMKASDLGRD